MLSLSDQARIPTSGFRFQDDPDLIETPDEILRKGFRKSKTMTRNASEWNEFAWKIYIFVFAGQS